MKALLVIFSFFITSFSNAQLWIKSGDALLSDTTNALLSSLGALTVDSTGNRSR